MAKMGHSLGVLDDKHKMILFSINIIRRLDYKQAQLVLQLLPGNSIPPSIYLLPFLTITISYIHILYQYGLLSAITFALIFVNALFRKIMDDLHVFIHKTELGTGKRKSMFSCTLPCTLFYEHMELNTTDRILL